MKNIAYYVCLDNSGRKLRIDIWQPRNVEKKTGIQWSIAGESNAPQHNNAMSIVLIAVWRFNRNTFFPHDRLRMNPGQNVKCILCDCRRLSFSDACNKPNTQTLILNKGTTSNCTVWHIQAYISDVFLVLKFSCHLQTKKRPGRKSHAITQDKSRLILYQKTLIAKHI